MTQIVNEKPGVRARTVAEAAETAEAAEASGGSGDSGGSRDSGCGSRGSGCGSGCSEAAAEARQRRQWRPRMWQQRHYPIGK